MQLSDFDQSKCGKFCPNTQFTACQYYEEAENELENGFCSLPDFYRCLATTKKVIPLSYSSVSDFLTCHHLYYLKAIRGVRTKDEAVSSPLKMGTLWDKVLQKYLGGKIYDDAGQETTIPDIINTYQIDPMDVAKVKGIYRAYKDLEITVEPGYDLQAKIDLVIPFDKVWGDRTPVELLVTGYYDRKYPTSFVENKFSSRPDNYFDTYFLQSQIGTYFLADPELEYCIMEVVRVPDLKHTGRFKDEGPEDYQERIYQDVISRPSFYFPGWNFATRRYGKKYYRNEFNMEDLRSRYLHIFREIFDARVMDGWYRDDRACNNILPGISCDMLSCCRNGVMSENVYQIRKKKTKF